MRRLNYLSKILRFKIIDISSKSKVAHVASCLSCIDIIILIYEKILFKSLNSKKFFDKFILSKGHAAASLYVMLNHKKIISNKLLKSFNQKNSILEEHPSFKIPGVETSTGSLGHGLPVLCGMAYASKLRKEKRKHYILLGDGECNEGSIWEAALLAPKLNVDNLTVIVDFNKWQATGRSEEITSLQPLDLKWKSFGWHVQEINGHDFDEIAKALKMAKSEKNQPSIIIANTIKGKGVSFMEDNNNWHYRIPNKEELKLAVEELDVGL